MALHDPQPSTSKEEFSNDYFEHTLLDTTLNSIRLLRILPDLSNTGLVQCKIWHATTDAEYTCLSYVWGAETNQQTICINGKLFSCRRNLWDFLSVARIKYPSGSRVFWIDAVCIDQLNISERNHQVRQMGDIYARAIDVIAWLGSDQGPVEFFIFLNRLAAEQPRSDNDALRIWGREHTQGLQRSYLDFEANEYWTRAWITQEILQPREVSILVNDTQIQRPEFKALKMLLPTLQSKTSRPRRKVADELVSITDRCLEIYVFTIAGYSTYYQRRVGSSNTSSEANGNKLLDLLYLLGRRRCQVPRDRVHSLLAIAQDADHVPVDYSMPEHTFISSLLISYNQSMCLCSLARLAEAIDCTEPFISSAPHSLLVQLVLTTSEPRVEPRLHLGNPIAGSHRIACSECDHEILIDAVKEHVFCLGQECWATEGHLVVPKDMRTSHGATVSTIKLIIQHEEESSEYPLLITYPIEVLAFGPEVKAADDFLLRLKEPSLYSILLPFESLVDISLKTKNNRIFLCDKAENSLGGFNFVERKKS